MEGSGQGRRGASMGCSSPPNLGPCPRGLAGVGDGQQFQVIVMPRGTGRGRQAACLVSCGQWEALELGRAAPSFSLTCRSRVHSANTARMELPPTSGV